MQHTQLVPVLAAERRAEAVRDRHPQPSAEPGAAGSTPPRRAVRPHQAQGLQVGGWQGPAHTVGLRCRAGLAVPPAALPPAHPVPLSSALGGLTRRGPLNMSDLPDPLNKPLPLAPEPSWLQPAPHPALPISRPPRPGLFPRAWTLRSPLPTKAASGTSQLAPFPSRGPHSSMSKHPPGSKQQPAHGAQPHRLNGPEGEPEQRSLRSAETGEGRRAGLRDRQGARVEGPPDPAALWPGGSSSQGLDLCAGPGGPCFGGRQSHRAGSETGRPRGRTRDGPGLGAENRATKLRPVWLNPWPHPLRNNEKTPPICSRALGV